MSVLAIGNPWSVPAQSIIICKFVANIVQNKLTNYKWLGGNQPWIIDCGTDPCRRFLVTSHIYTQMLRLRFLLQKAGKLSSATAFKTAFDWRHNVNLSSMIVHKIKFVKMPAYFNPIFTIALRVSVVVSLSFLCSVLIAVCYRAIVITVTFSYVRSPHLTLPSQWNYIYTNSLKEANNLQKWNHKRKAYRYFKARGVPRAIEQCL